MTGNVVLLGFAIAGTPGLSTAWSSTSLAAFLVGAALGGRLALAMAAASRRRWLLTAALSEALLLVCAAIGFDIGSANPPSRLYAVIVLTALAMGLRNATVRRLAVADLTTTVLTGTLTGVAADSSVAVGHNRRFGRRAASVALMFAGGSGRGPAFTARACTPAYRGCGRRARRHGRPRPRPDATTGASESPRREWPNPTKVG